MVTTKILHQKCFITFFVGKFGQNWGKCSEKLEEGSEEAEFLHGKNIDHPEKKAQNSDFHWGPVHGGIGFLK